MLQTKALKRLILSFSSSMMKLISRPASIWNSMWPEYYSKCSLYAGPNPLRFQHVGQSMLARREARMLVRGVLARSPHGIDETQFRNASQAQRACFHDGCAMKGPRGFNSTRKLPGSRWLPWFIRGANINRVDSNPHTQPHHSGAGGV